MNRNQGIAYAVLALDLLNKIKMKITPELLAKQMDLAYDLYTLDEAEKQYQKIKDCNNMKSKNVKRRANCYIIDIFDTAEKQKQMIEKFCNNTSLEIGKFYITSPGENSEKFYELVQDITNKTIKVLIINIFSVYAMDNIERAIIVKLCRKNNINIIEI